MLVHHAQGHQVVGLQHVGLDVGAFDVELGGLAHQFQQRVHQVALAKGFGLGECVGEAGGGFGQRHQPRAGALVQGFEQRQHLVFQHAGHQPLAAVFAHLVQHKQRHGDGEAVFGVAGFVQVGGGAVHPAQPHDFGEGLGGDACGLVAHQLFFGEHQQAGLFLQLGLVPALEGGPGTHVVGHLLLVEGVDQLVVHQHVLPPGLVLQLGHLLNELLVGVEEGQAARPVFGHLAFDQRVADEDVAGGMGVELAEVDPAALVHQQAVQGAALHRGDLGGFFLPMGVGGVLLDEVAAHFFQPLGLDAGYAAPEQAGGFDQLGHHDPAARLFAEVGTGVAVKLDAARAVVVFFALAFAAHVAQQAGQHAFVQGFVTGGLGVEVPVVLGHHGVQLGVDVAPLAHAAHVDELLAQLGFLLAVAEFVGGGGFAVR